MRVIKQENMRVKCICNGILSIGSVCRKRHWYIKRDDTKVEVGCAEIGGQKRERERVLVPLEENWIWHILDSGVWFHMYKWNVI